MKYKMKHSKMQNNIKKNFTKIFIFALIFSIVLLASPIFLYAAWPTISINPISALIGEQITITGTGFGAAIGSGKITFTGSGDTTTVVSWADTQIVLVIPAGTTTGNITVLEATGTNTSNPATLTIEPAITDFNPTTPAIGEQLTITGTGFGAAIGSGKVTFTGSGDTTTVISWSNTQIVLNIPAGTTSGNVTVTETTGVATSNPVFLSRGRSPQSLSPAEPVLVQPVWVRVTPMTCWQVWINEDNDFQFIFWYPYKDNNWVRIYDMEGDMVYEVDLPKSDPNLTVDLPDGFYMVKTFHHDTLLQEFLIGKP